MLPGWFPGSFVKIPYRVYIGSTPDTATASTYTFTNHAIGTAHASRLVVVGVNWIGGLAVSRPLSSVTIGGVTATLHRQDVNATNQTAHSAVVSLAVASGTTATIVVNIGTGTALGCVVSVYAVYDLRSHTPFASAGNNASSGTSLSASLAVPGSGVGIASMMNTISGEDHTIGGLTEDADADWDSERYMAASAQKLAASAGLSVSQSSATSANANRVITTVSWR